MGINDGLLTPQEHTHTYIIICVLCMYYGSYMGISFMNIVTGDINTVV